MTDSTHSDRRVDTDATTLEPHYSAREAARLLDCSVDHIYDLIQAKRLPATNIGIKRAKIRIPESGIKHMLAAGRVAA